MRNVVDHCNWFFYSIVRQVRTKAASELAGKRKMLAGRAEPYCRRLHRHRQTAAPTRPPTAARAEICLSDLIRPRAWNFCGNRILSNRTWLCSPTAPIQRRWKRRPELFRIWRLVIGSRRSTSAPPSAKKRDCPFSWSCCGWRSIESSAPSQQHCAIWP